MLVPQKQESGISEMTTGIDSKTLKNIVEAALLAAGQSVTLDKLGELFDEESRPTKEEFVAALEDIDVDCKGRSFELKRTASGYRFQVRQELAPWISRLWEEKPKKYSRALLETLVLIAYRQPITRGDIEQIRGVAVSSDIIRTLMEREWVRVVGHRDVPGRPALFATTRQFLDYFNLKSLEELPPLDEIRDLDSINVELNFGLGKSADEEDSIDIDSETGKNHDDDDVERHVDNDPETQDSTLDTAESTDSAGLKHQAAADESLEDGDGRQPNGAEILSLPVNERKS
jgi:segregation and condensation protein B